MALNFAQESQLDNSIFWQKLTRRDSPYSFWIEVTARCNNTCRHCFVNTMQTKKEIEISFQEITAVADEAASMGCLNCTITGGEPLIRDDFAEIYIYLKKKGFFITLFTNATLITKGILEIFSKYPPREVQVSLYGSTRETYEKVTQCKDSFDAFIKGLDLLQSIGINIRLKAVAMKSNLHELPDMADFAIQKIGKPLTFDPMLVMRRDGDSSKNSIIASERISPYEIELLETNYSEIMKMEEKGCNRPHHPFGKKSIVSRLPCISATRSFFVSSERRIQRCPLLSHKRLTANLGEMSIRDFLAGFEERLDEEFGKMKSISNCSECYLINHCNSCLSWNFLETKTPNGNGNYFCQVAQNRRKYKEQ